MGEHWCPKKSLPEERHGHLLWFIIGLTVCTSPILLWIFRKKLLKKGEDKPPEQAQDQKPIPVGSRDIAMDDERAFPDVPSAAADTADVVASMAWGGASAAWAGMDLGGTLSEDSD